MASKKPEGNPSEAVAIRKVTPEITTLSVPFTRFGVFKFGGRGTIVKLASGSLAVFSPVTLTPEVQRTIASEGSQLKYIAAPDLEHHLHLTAWKRAFPDAEIIAPEGLWEKRQANPDFKDTEFKHIFKAEDKGKHHISEEFDSEFDVEYVYSHNSREIVFLHKPTRTVIEADLLFNLPSSEQYSLAGESPTSGILTKLILPLVSTKQPATGHKRFAWYILSARDREGFAKSMAKIDQWDFDRLIPCHGDVIETGAKPVFRNVFEWFLNINKKKE
jgi:hypothetical protein